MARLARTALGYLGYTLAGPAGGLIGTLLGGLLFPPRQERGPVSVAQLQLSVPEKGQVLPVIYGVQRVTGYYIWYGNFKKHDPAGGGKKGGGKGMQEGKNESSGVPTYSASLALGICEGVQTDAELKLLRVWAGDDVIWNSDGSVGAGLSLAFYKGLPGQAADPHIASVVASQSGGSTGTSPYRTETDTAPATTFQHTVQQPPVYSGTEHVYRMSTDGQSRVYFTKVTTLTGNDQYTVDYTLGQFTIRVATVGTQVTIEYQSVLTDTTAQDALAYAHTAYIVFPNFDMGPSTTPPNFTFEICRQFSGGGKVVFWKFNPATAFPQVLYSADGAAWTAQDFATAAGGQTNHLGQQLTVLGSKLLLMGDTPLAVYETTDLVTFTKRYGTDLQTGSGAYDGRITLRGGTTPWLAWSPNTPNVSPKIWEDNGSGYTQRFVPGASDLYVYHIADAFGTMWATFTTILKKWIGGTSWSDIWTSVPTLDFMVYWPAQTRLMLARQNPAGGSGAGQILAFDGTTTPPPAVLPGITDRVGFMVVIGNDLYVMAIVTTNGITGNTWKIYRCTDLTTSILIGQGTLTNTVRPTLALVWHPPTTAFYAAIGSASLQKIYKATSPTSGSNPAPTSQLTFTEVYSASESSSNHIRDGTVFGEPPCADVNQAQVLNDLIVNTRYGLSKPASGVDATTYNSVLSDIETKDLKVSPVLAQSQSALQHFEEILSTYDGFLVPSQGLIKFGIRKVATTSTIITLEDFTKEGMPAVSRQGIRDTKNRMVVEYVDRSHQYAPAIAKVDNDLSIMTTGERVEQIILPAITRLSVATHLASHGLATLGMQKMGISHGLDPKWGLMEPGDLYGVSSSKLGVTGQVFRIVGFGEDPRWGIRAESIEEPLANLTADPNYTSQPPGPFFPPPGPSEVATTIGYIVELPYEIAGANLRLAILGAGAGTGWLGCDVSASRDGIEYVLIGSLAKGTTGLLTSPLGTSDEVDFLQTVDVDLSESEGTVLSTSRDGFWAMNNLLVVKCTPSGATSPGVDANRNVEWIAFQNATLLTTSRYRLDTFLRELFDFPQQSHVLGEKLVRFDPTKALVRTFLDSDIGKRLYFKFDTKMQFGNNVITVNPTYLAYVPQGLAVQPDPIDLLQVVAGGVKLGQARRF